MALNEKRHKMHAVITMASRHENSQLYKNEIKKKSVVGRVIVLLKIPNLVLQFQ